MSERTQARLDRQDYYNFFVNKSKASRSNAALALALVDAMLKDKNGGTVSAAIANVASKIR